MCDRIIYEILCTKETYLSEESLNMKCEKKRI